MEHTDTEARLDLCLLITPQATRDATGGDSLQEDPVSTENPLALRLNPSPS